MATEANFNKDDEEDQPQSNGGIASQADQGGGAAPAPMQRATPSGTPNIQSYMKANQGAGQQLAQGIGNQFQKQTNQLGQQVKQSGEQLKAQANPLEKNLGEQATNTIKTSFQNPQDILKQQDQLKQFQQLRDKGYQGDINALGQNAQQSQQQLQSQLGNIQQQAKGAGTESGRFQLLRNTFGQPQYTQGQQKLDQLFLQAQPGANRDLQQNLSNQTNQVKQQLGGTSAEIQSRLNALNGLSNQNAQQIQDTLATGNLNGQKLGTGFNDINENVKNEYQNALANSVSSNEAMKQALASNRYSPEQLNRMGLAAGQQTWGVDVGAAGQYSANPLEAAEQGGYAKTATPEEFARYNALAQLAGGSAPKNIFGSSQASDVGTYNPINFNTDAYNQAVKEKQNTINKTDLLNAMSTIKHSGISGNGSTTDQLNESIRKGISNGTMTPEQANQKINEMLTTYARNSADNSAAPLAAMYSPFTNYYNSKYLPASNARLGEANPESSPLPFTPGSGIDWGKIKPPKGK